jgi:hypothetical protein
LKDRLAKDIEEATSACEYATFVFDEVDLMPVQLLDVILFYIDFHTPTRSQPIDFRKTIFIFIRYKKKRQLYSYKISFCSNTGGTSIIELAQKYHLSSIKREDYNILEIQQVLSDASFNEQGKNEF